MTRFSWRAKIPVDMNRALIAALALTAAAAAGDAIGGVSTVASNSLELGICQIDVGFDKQTNIKTAREAISQAASAGAKLIVLPECWNSPYGTEHFARYAERVPVAGSTITSDRSDEGASVGMLRGAAQRYGVTIVGGSIPERAADGRLFNTAVAVGPDGTVLAVHRKTHLFDVDVPGKITNKESDVLTSGGAVTTFELEGFGLVGIGICYDLRFPELASAMRARGARLLLYPGAFSVPTGEAHWEALLRARAIDNQLYVAAASPARSAEPGAYQAWGHSTVVNPWGEVVATTGERVDLVRATLDVARVAEVRPNYASNSNSNSNSNPLTPSKESPSNLRHPRILLAARPPV